jgi:predicted  nucleic acid-binding Zn-ribbon protein
MTKKPRYEIRTGKFGQYFYDAVDERDLALADVLALLNDPDHIANKTAADLQVTRRELADYMKRAEDRARELAVLRCDLSAVKDANNRLGADYERARSQCTALSMDLRREQEGMADLRRRFGARDDDTMFSLLSRHASTIKALQARNKYLDDKIARIVELTPIYRDGYQTQVIEIASEQLPLTEPVMFEIETERALLFREIDKTLQEAGVWVGGRLDSIRQLIEMTKPSWGAGDEYVANLREQWGQINELVEKSVGRTKGQSLAYDVARLVDGMRNTSEQQAGDEHMGDWVYCKAHRRPHRTGWCTVPPREKIPLNAKTEKDAYAETRKLKLPIFGED